MKLDLFTNATVVDDVIRFVFENQKGSQNQLTVVMKMRKKNQMSLVMMNMVKQIIQ
jgi:hypothetical protein